MKNDYKKNVKGFDELVNYVVNNLNKELSCAYDDKYKYEPEKEGAVAQLFGYDLIDIRKDLLFVAEFKKVLTESLGIDFDTDSLQEIFARGTKK